MIYSLKLRNMHAECQFEVMTYIAISKPAGHEVKPVKNEPVYIWITFLGLGIPFKI